MAIKRFAQIALGIEGQNAHVGPVQFQSVNDRHNAAGRFAGAGASIDFPAPAKIGLAPANAAEVQDVLSFLGLVQGEGQKGKPMPLPG